jgi:nucleoid-associated protein YgaU
MHSPTIKEDTMGLFDRFTKSLDDEVNEALEKIRGMNLGIRNLNASIDDKVVTLTGTADTKEAKFKAMEVFTGLVTKARNTLNTIRIEEPAPAPEPAAPTPTEEPASGAPAEERIHEVVSGDTLGAIAQTYYGKASLYMKIFEANRDILDDPNLIKVGQKLRIPE